VHLRLLGRLAACRRGLGRSLRRADRRLGPLDYTLLALIMLGVAITAVMAILNPAG